MHTGELAHDSPGVSAALMGISPEVHRQVVAAYRLAATHGALLERAVRSPGVSFNPRPARVVSLLLKEAAVTAAEPLVTAVLGTATTLTPSTHETGGEEWIKLSRLSSYLLQRAPADPELLTLLLPQLPRPTTLAYLLDTVRHLHQWQDRNAARWLYGTIKTAMNEVLSDAPPSPPPSERLVKMLHQAVRQQGKIFSEGVSED
jgi:hypothetical protein